MHENNHYSHQGIISVDYDTPELKYVDIDYNGLTYRIRYRSPSFNAYVDILIKRPWYIPNKNVSHHEFPYCDQAIKYYRELVKYYKANPDKLPLS